MKFGPINSRRKNCCGVEHKILNSAIFKFLGIFYYHLKLQGSNSKDDKNLLQYYKFSKKNDQEEIFFFEVKFNPRISFIFCPKMIIILLRNQFFYFHGFSMKKWCNFEWSFRYHCSPRCLIICSSILGTYLFLWNSWCDLRYASNELLETSCSSLKHMLFHSELFISLILRFLLYSQIDFVDKCIKVTYEKNVEFSFDIIFLMIKIIHKKITFYTLKCKTKNPENLIWFVDRPSISISLLWKCIISYQFVSVFICFHSYLSNSII